jgi:Co/Zn/Cd efflux system component
MNAYLTNLYAEHVKEKYGSISINQKILIKIGIPMVSAVGLVAVTTFVLIESIQILAHPSDDSGAVNIAILFGFSAANAGIDILSLILFWLRGPDTVLHEHEHNLSAEEGQSYQLDEEFPVGDPQLVNRPHQCNGVVECCIADDCAHVSVVVANEKEDGVECVFESGDSLEGIESGISPSIVKTRNTNMMSALTHLSGDTLRTLAVLTAALIATFADQPSSKCDAVASLVVSFSIFGILVPLIREISKHVILILEESSASIWKMSTITDNLQYNRRSVELTRS